MDGGLIAIAAGIGAGLVTIGAAQGIGKITAEVIYKEVHNK